MSCEDAAHSSAAARSPAIWSSFFSPELRRMEMSLAGMMIATMISRRLVSSADFGSRFARGLKFLIRWGLTQQSASPGRGCRRQE